LHVGLKARAPANLRKSIKRADSIVAYFEATQLAGFDANEAAQYFRRPSGITVDALNMEPMPAIVAEAAFLDRLHKVEIMA